MDFNQFKDNYNDIVNQSLPFSSLNVDFFTKVKASHIISSAKKYGKINTKILDFGCGIGNYHHIIKESFSEIHGLDTSLESLNKAFQEHPFVKYSHYTDGNLPYNDNFFDIVYSICVFHHIPPEQWIEKLNELKRILKPNGLLLIFEHNPFNFGTLYIVNKCPLDTDAVLVTPLTLNKLLKESGFTKKIETNYILTLPIRKMNSINKLFHKIPIGAQYYKAILK